MALAVVTAAGVLTLFVLPGRTLWQQRSSVATTRSQIALLNRENAVLAGQIAGLHTDAEIEQIARQRYGLIQKGERAFTVLPPVATTIPTAPPVSVGAGRSRPTRTAPRTSSSTTTPPTTGP